MTLNYRGKARTAILPACWFTAVLNALFSASYAQDTAAPPPSAGAEEILRYGPVDIRPTLQGSVVYDDNIYIQSRDEQADVIWTISPGIFLGAGDYRVKEATLLTIEYTPSFIFFREQNQNDAVDHEARLSAQWHPASWTFGLQQAYQAYSGAVLDIGNRADRKIYTTTLAAKYEISPKTSVELNGRQSINDYERLIGFNEWVVETWADYGLTPLLKVGAGLSAGFVDIAQNPNQTYQQLRARAAYTLTEKVELRASAGGELRQYDSGRNDRLNGVFSLGMTYKPLVNTIVALDAYRRDQNSVVLAGQNYTTTGLSVGLQQLIREKYTVRLAGGYENADYNATQQGIRSSREDDYFFLRFGFDWKITDRLIAAASYQYRQDDSNSPEFGFDNHQFGLSVAYRF